MARVASLGPGDRIIAPARAAVDSRLPSRFPHPVPKSGQTWVRHFEKTSPIFEPFAPLAGVLSLHEHWPTLEDYTALVGTSHSQRGLDLPRLSFAPPAPKPRRRRPAPVVLSDLYDGSIVVRRQVPCVPESYHDLFNALIFAALPRSKHALHTRQFQALRDRIPPGSLRLPATRSREQDALTVFDEGGSVLIVSPEFYHGWRASSQHVLLEPNNSESKLVVFGHALLEHIFYGRQRIRSCALILIQDEDYSELDLLAWTDDSLSRTVDDRARFNAPGADGVVQVDEQGRAWLECR